MYNFDETRVDILIEDFAPWATDAAFKNNALETVSYH